MSPDRPPGPLPAGLTRDALVAEVARVLRVVPEGAAVVVALSGGPDSTALAYLTTEARPDLAAELGHVRHGLRDDAEDLATVRWHASALAAPLHELDVTVRPAGAGPQAGARAARYAALRRLARDVGAGWVLVGHTADDQAETVLLRLARGVGLTGLGAMAPVRGDLVRPLLRLRRSDVHRFVLHEGLRCVADPTNADPGAPRVAAREQVLPALGRLGSDPVGAIGRLADLVRDDASFLDGAVADLAAEVVRSYGPTRAVPHALVQHLERPLARRLLRLLVVEVRGGDPPSAAQVEQLRELRPGQAVDLPGVVVTCGGGWVAAVPTEVPVPGPVPLDVPGRVRWTPLRADLVASADGYVLTRTAGGPSADEHVQLTIGLGDRWEPPDLPPPPGAVPPGGDPGLAQAVLGGLGDAGEVNLCVRARRPGDRIHVDGRDRKLKDVLIDRGVPRAARELVPVVVAGGADGRVLFVPGVAVDDRAVEAGRRQPALHLGLAT